MRIQHCLASAAMLTLLSGTSSGAAQTLSERNISAAQAMAVMQATMRQCPTASVAVVDRSGEPRAMLRADGSAPHNLELARRKAYTARTFRITSLEWRDRSAGASETAGQRMLEDVIPLGGGVPIMIGTDAIGGVGVSGAAGGQPADEACARAGIAAIAGQLQ